MGNHLDGGIVFFLLLLRTKLLVCICHICTLIFKASFYSFLYFNSSQISLFIYYAVIVIL